MYPTLCSLPYWGLKIPAYGVTMLLGCLGALWITIWRIKREDLDVEHVYGLAAWLFLGGAIGARLLFVLVNLASVPNTSALPSAWWNGNIFYGCIIGGLAASLVYWWRNPFPFWKMADAVAPALAIGITFGRIGCFLHGCCYGAVTGFPVAVCFPAGSHAWASHVESGLIAPASSSSLPVHATQLYAAGSGLAIFAILLFFHSYRGRDGRVMALLMITYSILRWPMEQLRGDETVIFGGMTLSQNISLLLLVGGTFLWHRLSWLPTTSVFSAAITE